MLLNTLGTHLQLQKITESGDKLLFPINTIDDIIVNEQGDTLSNFLITVDDDLNNPTEKAPFALLVHGEDEITDHLLSSILMEKWSGYNTYSDLSQFTYDFMSNFTYDQLASDKLK